MVMLPGVIKKVAMGLGIALVVLLGVRIYESQQGPTLQPWHTWQGDEMSARDVDNATFAQYQAREQRLFAALDQEVIDRVEADQQTPLNRFYRQSLVFPARFNPDWNRSFVLLPDGKPRGAVVLLHGLTDSPYSMRDLARRYQQRGFVAVVPRLPGHGTAPGALTDVNWEAWQAVARLAVREATRIAGSQVPLELVGYSNGGALAMKYALDSLDDGTLRKPQRIVLLSPMIGVTAFARFAGLAGIPALLPAFAKSAWLNITPEYNPYKYNSFPVNAARQSWLLTRALQRQLADDARQHKLDALPPVLTFQSVMDSTVSTRAVVSALYNLLPANGSALVVFDINQAAIFRPLFKPSSFDAVSTLLPPAPRRYDTTVITNASAHTFATVARTTRAGEVSETVQPLGVSYPQEMYSLSHVAIPFPPDDPLYGSHPGDQNRFGVSLGNVSLRGETSVLGVSVESLMRATSNPFYDDMLARVVAFSDDVSAHGDK